MPRPAGGRAVTLRELLAAHVAPWQGGGEPIPISGGDRDRL